MLAFEYYLYTGNAVAHTGSRGDEAGEKGCDGMRKSVDC